MQLDFLHYPVTCNYQHSQLNSMKKLNLYKNNHQSRKKLYENNEQFNISSYCR